MAKRRTRIEQGTGLALVVLGILSLIIAVALFFVPFDGPVGEIVFGLIGVAVLAAGGTRLGGRRL